MKPSGTENPEGWGLKLEKPSVGGGVWIFSGTKHCKLFRAFWSVLACIRSTLKSPSGTVGIVGSNILSGKDEKSMN